jgi:hypothetical protein
MASKRMPTEPCPYLDSNDGGAGSHPNDTLYVVLCSNATRTVCAVTVLVIRQSTWPDAVGTRQHVEVGVAEGHAGVQHSDGYACCGGGGGGADSSDTAHACGWCLAAAGDQWHCISGRGRVV